jgi:hypothetical protein
VKKERKKALIASHNHKTLTKDVLAIVFECNIRLGIVAMLLSVYEERRT